MIAQAKQNKGKKFQRKNNKNKRAKNVGPNQARKGTKHQGGKHGDTGATRPMTCDRTGFVDYHRIRSGRNFVMMGNGAEEKGSWGKEEEKKERKIVVVGGGNGRAMVLEEMGRRLKRQRGKRRESVSIGCLMTLYKLGKHVLLSVVYYAWVVEVDGMIDVVSGADNVVDVEIEILGMAFMLRHGFGVVQVDHLKTS
ncbi:hypothetical protein ACH5RR_000801 [Cinchona calisaya]|uniref:Uncharacterized protein n=1 Tax=Cinchona calisaya TaxID=153742 RepID=A0ABD3B1L9_9GENT